MNISTGKRPISAMAFSVPADILRAMIREWLINALETSGKGEGELARHLRLPGSAISRMKKGTRAIKAEEIFKIARFLNVPLPDEALPLGEPARKPGTPVIGSVAAEYWRNERVIERPYSIGVFIGHENAYALHVRDESAEPLFPQNSYCIAVPYDELRVLQIRPDWMDGDVVHIERRREDLIETTLRRVRVDPDSPARLKAIGGQRDDIEADSPNVTVKGLAIALYREIR